MAHTCPDCGLTCYCGGDIDDICFGDDCEEADRCTHYEQCQDRGDFDYEDDEVEP